MTSRGVKEWPPRELLTRRPPHPQHQRLEQALQNYHHDLQGLQSALVGFKEALVGFKEALLQFEEGALNEESAAQHQQNDQNLQLLSVAEVCLRLGSSDKSSVHQKLRSGEIPSLKSGQATKVRQRDLEEYISGQQRRRRRHRTLGEENGLPH
jgi:excisionase family DNA binding protein